MLTKSSCVPLSHGQQALPALQQPSELLLLPLHSTTLMCVYHDQYHTSSLSLWPVFSTVYWYISLGSNTHLIEQVALNMLTQDAEFVKIRKARPSL